MQQTNVIHVAQGGTVILPGQSQNTQVNHHGNQQVNQARSDIKLSKHVVENDRLILPQNILNFGSFLVSPKSRELSRKILPGHQRSK